LRKAKKRPVLGRKLEEFDKEEREAEEQWLDRHARDVDLTDYVPDPEFENEFFGGFRSSNGEIGVRCRFIGRRALRSYPVGWAAEPAGLSPIVLQACRAAEGRAEPVADPPRYKWPKKERFYVNPDGSFARGSLHAERMDLYGRHTVRRTNAVAVRGYKPSGQLELKRFPKLKRVKVSQLLTRQYLSRGAHHDRERRHAVAELLVAAFLARGGNITVCPPEKTAAQVAKMKVSPKRGRPPIYGKRMSNAEYQRRKRAKASVSQPDVISPALVSPLPQADGAGFPLLSTS
jgi:hypothetical protein